MQSSAAEIARAVNQEIRGLAERLNAQGDSDHEYGFSCEDGCGGTVPLTLAAFAVAGGAWLNGHEPTK